MSNAPRWRFERCTDPPASLTPPDLSKAPYGWKEQYEIIRKLRKSCKAPYDTDGPELLPNKLQGENVFHWQCLVAAILCGQSDHPAGVAASFRRLVVDTCNDDNFNFSQFSVLAAGGLTDAQIAGKIKGSPCASFGGKKASFIKMGADYINSKCDGKVPTTFTALKALPGVGVNTANLTLGFMGKPYTMPIYDPQEYIHTLCERMGWFKGGNFSDTIKSLETWFPYQGWHQLPRMLIGLGQILEEDAGVLVEAALSGADPLPAIKFLADIGVPLTRFAKSPSNEIHPYTVKFDVKTLAESKGLQDVVAYLDSREEVDKQIEERLSRKLAREAEEQQQRENAEAAARKESMARMAARQAARKSGNIPISNSSSNVPNRGLVKASNVPNRSIPNAPSTTKKRHSEGRKSVDGRKSGDIRKYAVEGKLGKERLSEMKSAEKKLVPALASARVSTGGEKRKFSDMKELNDALNARAHQKAAMRGEEVDMKKLMKEKNKAFAAMKKMKAGKASATPQQVRRQSKSDDVEIEPIFKPVPLMDGSAASSCDQAKKRPSDAKAKLILEQMKAKKRRTIGLSAATRDANDIAQAESTLWTIQAATNEQQLQALALMAQTQEKKADQMSTQSANMVTKTEDLFKQLEEEAARVKALKDEAKSALVTVQQSVQEIEASAQTWAEQAAADEWSVLQGELKTYYSKQEAEMMKPHADPGDAHSDKVQAAQAPYLSMVDAAKDQVTRYTQQSQEMFAASQHEAAEARKTATDASFKEQSGWHHSVSDALRRVSAMHQGKAAKYQEAAKKMYWAAYKLNQYIPVYESAANQAADAARAQAV